MAAVHAAGPRGSEARSELEQYGHGGYGYGAGMSSWDEPSTSAQGARREEMMANAWTIARGYLYPRDIGPSARPPRAKEDESQLAAVRYLVENGRREEMVREVMDAVRERFGWVRRDVRGFMSRMQESAALSRAPQTDLVMAEMLDKLYMWHRRWAMPLRIFEDARIIATFTSLFQTLLHASLPADFLTYFETFLSLSLSRIPDHLADPPHHAHDASTPAPAPGADEIKPPSQHLSRLGMLPRYSATLSGVAYAEIERIVRQEADRGWDARRLPRIRQRVSAGVVNWLAAAFDKSSGSSTFLRAAFSRFDFFLSKCLFDIRTDELFDIIVDYPDSLAALEDLKDCMYKVGQRDVLVFKLKAANFKRLLHPGADTRDVLTQYISTIRCLRILDPPGVLLHTVAIPIRKHLRDRPDTTKEIVSALVEGDELQDENDAGGLIKESQDDAVEDFMDPKWEPEPIDAAPEFRSGKTGDIVSTLVSIFETRQVIVKELQILLAQRLLAVTDYDAVKEIRIIESLKLRFGEQALQVCDVMLKDVADSKRIDDRIHGDIKTTLHPLVISHHFWPPVPSSSLRLPPKLCAAHAKYEHAFHHFKPDKHLRFYQQLGTARLRLEMRDRTVEVEATALQAAVIEVMEQKDASSAEEVAETLEVSEGEVRSAMVFWAAEGIVDEDGGLWRVME